jgi:hypothetical protein
MATTDPATDLAEAAGGAPDAARGFGWSDRFELEHEEMDGIHGEFVALVGAHPPPFRAGDHLDAAQQVPAHPLP